jgi:succinate dehydrogenase / fumarate reductase cytochrome b subunit
MVKTELGGTSEILPDEGVRPKRASIMATTKSRPLSPHLTVWRWGPHMLVSILHRVTGGALSVAGLAILAWWLVAIADGPAAYAKFTDLAQSPFGLFVLVGLTWAFFQHLLSGIRHLSMDTGAAFELDTNKRFAILTIILSIALTALLWAWLLGVRP